MKLFKAARDDKILVHDRESFSSTLYFSWNLKPTDNVLRLPRIHWLHYPFSVVYILRHVEGTFYCFTGKWSILCF